jgi:HEXXH motif-containing protein
MREAATKNDVAGIQSLYDAHGHILYETDRSHPCEIKPLGTPSLGPSQCALFSAAFQDDIGLTTQLEKPSDAMGAKFNDLFAHIKPTLQKHLPLWWAELESLVKTIILATAKENKFGGASAFSAWGSILINPASCVSALSTALTIVHESSHLKLFYAYLDDEIVLNNPSERYASPLRREARPMNGIYHAAFVLARMVAFLEDLKGVDKTIRIFDGTSAQDIEDEQHRSIKAFDAAYSIIASEGILTPLGQEIITESADVVARCSKN